MSVEDDVDAIRRRMAEVRRDLHEDLQDAAESTRQLSDWRRYVTLYPTVSVAAAFAIGYWIVPRRGPQVRLTSDSLARLSLVKAADSSPAPPVRRWKGSLLGMAGTLAMRYALGVASQHATSILQGLVTSSQQGASSENGSHRPKQSSTH